MRPKLPFRKPRSRAKAGPAFVFVDAAEGLAGGPRDEEARILIRRQAARSGRKHQRTQSARQSPSSISGEGPLLVTDGCLIEPDEVDSVDHSIAPQPSFTGYEALRATYNFDITYLASFTDVDLGKAAALPLQSQPSLLSSLLQQRSTSFLSYLPSRYGSSRCLDDAIHCVAARAGQMFGYSTRAATISKLYGKALRSLQHALSDSELCMGVDVYCATRLLTLYEFISPPEENHWVLHNRGGIKLLELRGPENHKTKFDWMLLKSVAPSILLDEMYRLRSVGIFEAPSWQDLFAYASESEMDRDSSLWWEFFRLTCHVTGVVSNMRDTFTTSTDPSEYCERTSKILERARWVRQMLHDGHVRYQTREPYPSSLFDLPSTPESPDRIRLRGFYFHPRMQICRVITTLSPDEMERASAEVEAQTLAAQALLIQQATVKLDPAMSWYFEQKNPFAHSIIRTREKWVSQSELPWGELRDVLAQRWLKWHYSWRGSHLSQSLEEKSS
ncbi:uncharacterized protein DSM5745_00664 [Aspergillus mulundensis]|uniref:Uncharacterized protein n=1 Tax=Aspergillus mulundensis TaxID=1810919 RepID=A0A3D8T451_9EURO|nr:Uncharacterized protein DSM5745_00664 [Aspergillus mulundensis]RDW93342.1 Uncharacterized protein DSM5745_00664 [Aspergillus mulundensis]